MTSITRLGTMCRCYLIEGEDGSVLVDTGTKGMRAKVLRQIRGRNVRLIVLTHGHGDHVANAAAFSKLLRVPVAMHAADYVLIAGCEPRPLEAQSVIGKAIRRFATSMELPADMAGFAPDLLLEEGFDLAEYGVPAMVRALPGHTLGSIGILVEKDDFIVGDAMMNLGGAPQAQLYEDRAAMLQSLRTIRESGAKWAHVGHGPRVSLQHFR